MGLQEENSSGGIPLPRWSVNLHMNLIMDVKTMLLRNEVCAKNLFVVWLFIPFAVFAVIVFKFLSNLFSNKNRFSSSMWMSSLSQFDTMEALQLLIGKEIVLTTEFLTMPCSAMQTFFSRLGRMLCGISLVAACAFTCSYIKNHKRMCPVNFRIKLGLDMWNYLLL